MASRLILKEFDEPQGRLTDNLQTMRRDLVERVSFGMPVFSGAGGIFKVEFDEIGVDEVNRRYPRPLERHMVIENRIGSVVEIVPESCRAGGIEHLRPNGPRDRDLQVFVA